MPAAASWATSAASDSTRAPSGSRSSCGSPPLVGSLSLCPAASDTGPESPRRPTLRRAEPDDEPLIEFEADDPGADVAAHDTSATESGIDLPPERPASSPDDDS